MVFDYFGDWSFIPVLHNVLGRIAALTIILFMYILSIGADK
jgi:hypothetical protein